LRHYIVEIVNEVESTNSYLRDKLQNSTLKEPFCVSSYVQKAGRGQRGKVWYSEPFANVLASFLITERAHLTSLAKISNAAVLAAAAGIQNLGIKGVRIKWPNDVYVGDKKIAGVLIENVISGNGIKSSIVGVGLNVNQKEFSEVQATSIALETGKKHELTEVLYNLYQDLYDNLAEPEIKLLFALNRMLYKKEEYVTFEEAGRLTEYKVRAVQPDGKLLVASESAEYLLEHHKATWIK